MIYDCFMYYKEVDVLRIRLEELYEVVDVFFVVEAEQTFRGGEKKWSVSDVDLPEHLRSKLQVLRIKFPLEITDPWEREAFQRSSLCSGLQLEEEDLVLISDCDEIPRASVVDALTVSEPTQLDVDLYYMDFNWRVPVDWNQGGRPMAVRKSHLLEESPHQLRSNPEYVSSRIPDAGWHFSYFGGLRFIQNKIHSFSHAELDQNRYTDDSNLKLCMKNGIDPFNRFLLEDVDPKTNDTLPAWVKENLLG